MRNDAKATSRNGKSFFLLLLLFQLLHESLLSFMNNGGNRIFVGPTVPKALTILPYG